MKKILLTTVLLIALLIGCKTKDETATSKKLTIKMEPKSDSDVSGEATFTEKKGRVFLVAKLSGLKPGVHAIHIHEKSDCSAADGSSSGGHWNPTFKKHGKWGKGEYHKGDIGNFSVNLNGEGTVVFQTDEWCIGCGDSTKDILGKGLIVHQDPDDLNSQPTGNAGARVACSAIIK